MERLRFKEWQSDVAEVLDLLPQDGQLNDLDDEFWESFDGLNQIALLARTSELLEDYPGDMSIADIAQAIPPSHDLEAISLWLSMAMASDTVKEAQSEQLDIEEGDGAIVRFTVPKVALNSDAVQGMDFEV